MIRLHGDGFYVMNSSNRNIISVQYLFVCMYVCMYIMYMYACMRKYVYVYVYVCICMYIYMRIILNALLLSWRKFKITLGLNLFPFYEWNNWSNAISSSFVWFVYREIDFMTWIALIELLYWFNIYLYVCMYVFIHVCMYVFIHVCMYVHIHIHMPI